MMEYEEGDMVEFINQAYDGMNLHGLTGEVVEIYDATTIGVDWQTQLYDLEARGHDCDGRGTEGQCWRVPISYVKKVNALITDWRGKIKNENSNL